MSSVSWKENRAMFVCQTIFIEFVIIVRSGCRREEALFFLVRGSCKLSKMVLQPLISNTVNIAVPPLIKYGDYQLLMLW